MTAAFFLPRRTVALNLVALPFILIRSMFRKAVEDFQDIRADIIPALRYILTGSSVPGATRAAVKAGVSQAATAVSSPVARFSRKHIANRLLSLVLFVSLPLLIVYFIVRVVYEEIDWPELASTIGGLFLGIFDNRAI